MSNTLKERIIEWSNGEIDTEANYERQLQEILDDVAKEFPMTEQQIRILTGTVNDADVKDFLTHPANEFHPPDAEEIAKWFVKNFGGKPK